MSAEHGPDRSQQATQDSEARREHAEAVEASRRKHRRDVSATKRGAKVARGRLATGVVGAIAAAAGAGELVDRQIEHDTLRGERQAPIADSIEQRTQEQAGRQEAFERMKRDGTIDAEALQPDASATEAPAETGLTGRDGTVDIDGVTGSVELDQGADYEATSGIIPDGDAESGGLKYESPETGSAEGGGLAAS
ncbi:MAG: hypothetical protein M3N59_01570 [bacterium]|nr:hypothetical protein [bacterium]